MLSRLNPINMASSIFSTIRTHKWKSAIAGVVLVGGFSVYKKVTSGYHEITKIMEQLEKLKGDMPEGQGVEDGTEEELDFFKDMFGKISEQVDPALETVVNNINRTNQGQIRYLLNELKNAMEVENLQSLSKSGDTPKAKLEAWDKLRTESVRELFHYIYLSQIFFCTSIAAFSMTGKHLFELNAGQGGGMDNMTDMASALERMANGEQPNPAEEEKKANEDEERKQTHQNKEKAMNIVHKHFMTLIFDVLTSFTSDLKPDVLDP